MENSTLEGVNDVQHENTTVVEPINTGGASGLEVNTEDSLSEREKELTEKKSKKLKKLLKCLENSKYDLLKLETCKRIEKRLNEINAELRELQMQRMLRWFSHVYIQEYDLLGLLDSVKAPCQESSNETVLLWEVLPYWLKHKLITNFDINVELNLNATELEWNNLNKDLKNNIKGEIETVFTLANVNNTDLNVDICISKSLLKLNSEINVQIILDAIFNDFNKWRFTNVFEFFYLHMLATIDSQILVDNNFTSTDNSTSYTL